MSIAIILLSEAIRVKTLIEKAKNSPFECGFDIRDTRRQPFSVHFFFICVVFLIFDVELLILLPLIRKITTTLTTALLVPVITFVLVLFRGGLLYE